VDVLPLDQVRSLAAYAGVVIGGPMIMGWHRAALRFLRRHRRAFKRIPVAVFVMAMSLTEADEAVAPGVAVIVDKNLPKPPASAGRLTFRERYARVSSYARPILRALQPVRPAALAFFGGRLEYGRLKWWAVLFAMLVIRAPGGDRRNWPAIRAWAAGLPDALFGGHP
jgi:menaquinone-dependent protoporphyrinogen oxidase